MRAFLAIVSALALCACQQKPADPAVTGAWVRLPAVRENPGAAYFTLTGGKDADALVKVTTPIAIRTELHESAKGGSGMMSMQPLRQFELPSHGSVSFAPSGKHVMLFDVSPHVRSGETVPLTLSLAGGRTLETQAKVVGPADPAPQ